MTIGAAQQFFLGASKATGGGAAGYQIERSLRFNSSDSAFCSRTPAVTGNRTTFTWSGWVKRTKVGSRDVLFSTEGSGGSSGYTAFQFTSADVLFFEPYIAVTSAVFRDLSAWYHIQLAVDTNQVSAANRVQFYVNGVLQSSSATSLGQGAPTEINGAANPHGIGAIRYAGTFSTYANIYLADIHFIDGQALTPSSFTEVSATTGQLIPKTYSGSYGTNGFQLKFADNSSNTAATLGKDTSGNSNNWTPNNLSVSDFTVAVASGGLPIYNTSGIYGTTQTSGLRSDSNSSYLSLATALGTGSGLDLTDQNVSGRTSGLKTITNAGSVSASSASQFYSGSARFTGATESRASLASSPDFAFGTGDFTVEFWVKSEAAGINPSFFRRFFTTGGDSTASVQLGHIIDTSGIVIYYTDVTVLQSTTNILNKWCHIALARASGTIRLFVNGVLEASGTDTSNKTNNTLSIGNYNNTNDGRMQGELQDLRVYKGIAKYTSSFTIPSRTLAAGNDSLVDTPTSYGTDTGVGGEVRGNYCTLNPLDVSSLTTSNGNLQLAASAAGFVRGTMNLAGKTYWEVTITIGGLGGIIGVMQPNGAFPYTNSNGYHSGGTQYVNGSSVASWGASWAVNDIIGIAVDADAGTITAYKNGASQGSKSISTTATWMPWIHSYDGTYNVNFGQRAFAYPLSGFKALCDTNLGAPLVAKPNTLMDVVLWTGNNTARTISGLNFSPDLVWIKNRTTASSHTLYDTIRGATKILVPNGTDAELTLTNFLTAFTSDGFSIGTDNNLNGSGNGVVGWAWDAGTTTVSNTAGSITSQVRANASAGFSVVTYSSGGSGATLDTVGHGLGVSPSMVIAKNRDIVDSWYVIRSDFSNVASDYLQLNSTAAKITSGSTLWSLSSTTVGIRQGTIASASNQKIVLYCFAPVVGYSSFGSYVGNGSSDGPMVYTGFRPRWVLFKRSDTSSAYSDWYIIDSARNIYNLGTNFLRANSSDPENYYNFSTGNAGTFPIDFLSNGFKYRLDNSGADVNANGGTYIYAAFAESPFQYARAR